ncbi:hypothetical protein QZH41_013579 [Actinostola sp. cb2023]|nr:hypothetical protein QZH41_013579 [Actinostola sp. cb2023]
MKLPATMASVYQETGSVTRKMTVVTDQMKNIVNIRDFSCLFQPHQLASPVSSPALIKDVFQHRGDVMENTTVPTNLTKLVALMAILV